MMSSFRILVTCSLVLFSLSCKKSIDAPAEPECRIETFFDHHFSRIYYYRYTNNQLTQLEIPGGGRYKFEYANNRPSRRNLFIGAANVPNEKHDFTYDANGNLARIDFFELINAPTNLYGQYARYVFTYFDNKPALLEIYSVSNDISTLEEEYSYSSNAGNIISCHAKDYLPTVQTADIQYINDNSLNFFQKGNPHTLLTDLIHIDLNPLLLPMAVNKNNVVNVILGSSVTVIQYSLDERDMLSTFTMNGSFRYEFTYKCE